MWLGAVVEKYNICEIDGVYCAVVTQLQLQRLAQAVSEPASRNAQ